MPVSRAGLAAAGGTLGAGIVLALGQDTCPLGEVAQVAAFLAKESSGQWGPRTGLARHCPLAGRARRRLRRRGSAGRRAPRSGRGAGPRRCSHPDGAYRFVMSALDVFTDDLLRRVRPRLRLRAATTCRCPRFPARSGWRLTGPAAGATACVRTSCRTRAAGRAGLPGDAGHAGPAVAGTGRTPGRRHVPRAGTPAHPGQPSPGADTTQRGWVGRALSGGHRPVRDPRPDRLRGMDLRDPGRPRPNPGEAGDS